MGRFRSKMMAQPHQADAVFRLRSSRLLRIPGEAETSRDSGHLLARGISLTMPKASKMSTAAPQTALRAMRLPGFPRFNR
jgi:hypothetical protein